MILLISTAKNTSECLAAIEKELGEQVDYVTAILQGTAKVRAAEYAAIIVDQSLVDGNPIVADALWKDAGTAIPVYVNFAISSVDRVVRAVRAALTRRQREQLTATRAAEATLRNELTGAVAGILLSSELALAQPALPPAVVNKLRSVHELALQIKSRLGEVA